jgi:hypothetical protein
MLNRAPNSTGKFSRMILTAARITVRDTFKSEEVAKLLYIFAVCKFMGAAKLLKLLSR